MNDQQDNTISALLKQLTPGYLPYDIFIQLARLCVLSVVELLPLRCKDNRLEVLLILRASDDHIWANMWHSPGTVVRPTDHNMPDDQIRRIVNQELNGIAIGDPKFVMNSYHTTERGVENASIYVSEVLQTPVVGQFYSVDNLPSNIIGYQKQMISDAAKKFAQLTS